jgi:hypothetical protein
MESSYRRCAASPRCSSRGIRVAPDPSAENAPPGRPTRGHLLQIHSTNEGDEIKKTIATGALALAILAPSAASAATPGQNNARKKAVSYLEYEAFSRSGLIDQLKYEGFTTAQATYGVTVLHVNWNRQAMLKAKEYLDYDSFSRRGLLDQLEFEGFTVGQATYGVSRTGL